MRLFTIAPAALLLSTAVASPIQQLGKRQLDGLGGLLQIVKGFLPDTAAASGATNDLPGTSSVGGVSGSDTADTDCTDAVAKIDQALTVSTRLMQATGGQPSIAQILAVLGVLEDSLDDDCKETNKRDINLLAVRASECSQCEQALYKIVKELQGIFALANATGTASGDMPAGTGNLPSLPSDSLPSLTPPKIDASEAAPANITTTTNMTGSIDASMTTPQLRRRLLAASRKQET